MILAGEIGELCGSDPFVPTDSLARSRIESQRKTIGILETRGVYENPSSVKTRRTLIW